jgi:hypothetical protein
MGSANWGSGSQSSKSSGYDFSSSKTSESALSKTQNRILNERNQLFNDEFWPELMGSIESMNPNIEAGKAEMQLQADAINKSFGATDRQINQNIAQQGLSGSPSGVQAAMKAASERARSSALAQAYYNSLANADAKKANLLQIGASMMPQPTTAAPLHQTSFSFGQNQSKSSGSQFNGGGAIGN